LGIGIRFELIFHKLSDLLNHVFIQKELIEILGPSDVVVKISLKG
jgi:hypothetical protein